MAIRTFKELLRHPPKGAAYVVDTSFLINSIRPDSEEQKLKEAMVKAGSILTYNVTVRSEVIHLSRLLLFERALDREVDSKRRVIPHKPETFSTDLLQKWNVSYEELGMTGHAKLKELANGGYVDLFGVILGADGCFLSEFADAVLAGCTYADTKSFKVSLSWPTMFKLMAMYGLDCSDAMILNLAVSNQTFRGIISSDFDFLYCADKMDVVLPNNRPPAKTRPHLG